MGYRAQVITQEREYGSTSFGNWESFVHDFMPAVVEELDISRNENEDFFEVGKEQLQRYVDKLPENETASDYPSYSNRVLKDVLQQAINEAPGDWVSWEWF